MQSYSKKLLVLGVALVVFFVGSVQQTYAAQLILSPSSGTFLVGSTFDVGVFLDTSGKSANVVESTIFFPPDVLQLVSPTISQSVFSVWTAQPVFDNQRGIVKLSGGIPGGINVSRGLITNLTFRVKQATDSAIVKFSDASSVLANDGKGTDILDGTQSAVLKFILPPPAGPIVSSETHPDQSKWYSARDVLFRWASMSSVEQYSYSLSRNPTDIPDDIVDGSNTTVSYKGVQEGKSYFHIKSMRNGIWGGTTHFAINIESGLPADFKVEISPSDYTSSKFQLVSFETTDSLSGIDHYEMKIINLTPSATSKDSGENFFIEATSPNSLNLGLGTYDIIVRAYNKVGNYKEVTQRLHVVKPIFGIVTDKGLMIGSIGVIPWMLVWILLIIIIGILWYVGRKVHKWHDTVALKKSTKELPEDIMAQLADLKKYRQKYGKALIVFLALGTILLGSKTYADQKNISLSPPTVSAVSQNISNEDIFYIGGKTDSSGITVTVYIQNPLNNDAWSDDVISDKNGDWFYRHPTFLSPGNYLVWTQSKMAAEQSPPSPQISVSVTKTAIQLGSSRLSYESIYLFIMIVLLLVVAGLCWYIAHHYYHAKKKHKLFMKEIKEADESIRRGFAVLRRDIEAELDVVKRAKLTGELSKEEKDKEEQLMRDLESISTYTGKEIWEIEQLESSQ